MTQRATSARTRILRLFRKKDTDTAAVFSGVESILADSGYWEEYTDRLVADARPMFEDVFYAGCRAALRLPDVKAALSGAIIPTIGEKAVSEAVQLALDTLVAAGRAVVENMMLQWASGIARTTQNNLLSALSRAREDGLGSEYVLSRIKQDFTSARAQRIAVTECLPPETLVDGAMVSAGFRRRYKGSLVEITTRGGRRFSATANHPILSTRGWVGAGNLNEGDYLICDSGHERADRPCAAVPRDPYITTRPSTISQVFETLTTVGISERVRPSDVDFHGDGSDSDIDVLAPNGMLYVGDFSALYKPGIEHLLEAADMIGTRFCASCGRLLGFAKPCGFCPISRTDSGLSESYVHGSGRHAESTANNGRRLSGLVPSNYLLGTYLLAEASGRSQSSRIALAPRRSGLSDNLIDPIRVDIHFGRDSSWAQSGAVELDRVVSLRRGVPYSGHVYNLESPYGYYTIAGGVFSGNTTRFFGAGSQHVYRAAKLPGWEWQTVEDRWTCPICAGKNDEQYPISEDFSPAHVQCRCFPKPVTELSDRNSGTDPFRASRQHKNAYAWQRMNGTEMGINPSLWNANMIERKLGESMPRIEKRWDTTQGKYIETEVPAFKVKGNNSPGGTFTHEFGHSVDGYFTAHPNPWIREIWTDFKLEEGMVEGLSGYARTDALEQFAEAFAQMHLQPESEWHPYTRRARSVLDEVLGHVRSGAAGP